MKSPLFNRSLLSHSLLALVVLLGIWILHPGTPAGSSGGPITSKSTPARHQSPALLWASPTAPDLPQGGLQQHESLGAAFSAARHAVEKINPNGRHSRGADYFAANPGQQLRAWFSSDGIELASGIPTPEDEEPWNLKLHLRAIGRGHDLTSVSPGAVSGEGSRIEIEHKERQAPGCRQNPADRKAIRKLSQGQAGASRSLVTQWFENDRHGLEQGFTIGASPAGDPGEVTVLLESEGSLHVEGADGEESIRFVDESGAEVVHYTGLKAWDASGRMLASRMEARDASTVALLVSDAGARYPLMIDPLFANVEARLLPEPAEEDEFGSAVAIAGDLAVVGAHEDDSAAGTNTGSAYVFVHSGGTWNQQIKLTVADGMERARFGHAVACSGNTALVGAPGNSVYGETDPGRVYVFERLSAGWSQQAELGAPHGGVGDEFGCAVAIEGDTALVGSRYDDTSTGPNAGSAHVFVRDTKTWSHQAMLEPLDAAQTDQFGRSVALSGETAVVGAPMHDTTGGLNAGAAYVFQRSGTEWSQQANLTASDGAFDDRFGTAVALDGETAVAGSPWDDTGDGSDAGSAYVFVRSVKTWIHQTKLTAGTLEADADDHFGWSVALSGETALVGSILDAKPTDPRAGTAYVFVRSGATWSRQAILGAGDPGLEDQFGTAVALSGDTALVGAPRDDTGAGPDAGSAWVFVRSGSIWSQSAALLSGDETAGDWFGESMALEGDTALIGVSGDDTPAAPDSGSAYVFVRSGALWHQQSKITADDGAAGDRFGKAVALSGELALIGAPDDDSPVGIDIGSAYVFERSGVLWNMRDKLVADDAESGGLFGQSVALDGGTALLGSPRANTVSGAGSGAAYLFEGGGSTWTQQEKFIPESGSVAVLFGASVALDGETALVGSSQHAGVLDPFTESAGAVYVFVRNGGEWSEEARLGAADAQSDAWFGIRLAMSGETALVGASRDDTEVGVDAGSAYVFVREGTSWTQQAKLVAADAEQQDRFAESVALSGDIALMGAPSDDTGAGELTGSAYVFVREGPLWHQERRLTAGVDTSPRDYFGMAVALDGDTALVGSTRDDTNGTDAGSAYAFLLGELPEITSHPVSRTVPLTVPGTPVTFEAKATGHAPLLYRWRKDGSNIPGAGGILIGGTTSYTIPAVAEADAGLYDVLVWNVGGSVTSSPATLAVNALSEFDQVFPGLPPEAAGIVLVNLSPSGIGGAWRLRGEQRWRMSGTAAFGLTTSDRVVEFRPLPGTIHPPAETVSVISGGAAVVLDRSYYDSGAAGGGGLSVTLKPDDIAALSVPEADRAQWRFLGEGADQWRDSGTSVSGLVPGHYLIECKPVDGRITPRPASVLVEDGQTPAPILTYFLQGPQTGSAPVVLGFELVSGSMDLPYAYVGQIRSDVGASSGFVVRERVVATAGHVVFDDGMLAAVTGLQWLFQRSRGSHEPEPQIPRGFYLFDGYSAQRAAEGTPGSSSPASQELDVAALYFDEPAGRGGFGGFLASDAAVNEWLSSDVQKMLVGYPVEDVPANRAGRMHATPAADLSFTPGGSAHTYTTSDIRSSGGTSGGPLCVQFEGGPYYPAAIYLGGTGQTVVRTIDSDVILLFDAAEDSAATGNNNTGGGITLTSVTPVATPADPGILKVTIEPAAARTAGGGWRLAPETVFRPSGSQVAGLNPATYTMELTTVAGFQAPAPQAVEVIGGSLNEITFEYAVENSELETWRMTHFGTTSNTGDAADDADPDGDGSTNIEEFTAGTDPNDWNDVLRILSAEPVGSGFTVSLAGKAGRLYELERSENLGTGSWSTRASIGPLDHDVPLVLTDPSAPADRAFYRVRVSKP